MKTPRTNAQRQILQFPTTPLAPDRTQPPRNELGRLVSRLLVDNHLHALPSIKKPPRKGKTTTHQIHVRRNQLTTRPGIDRRLLAIPTP
jgi:hypothetical protein